MSSGLGPHLPFRPPGEDALHQKQQEIEANLQRQARLRGDREKRGDPPSGGMVIHLGPRTVVAPDGVEWRVARRWSSRRFGWTWKRRRISGDVASELAPEVFGMDLQEAGLVVVGVATALLIVIPLLFFGLELIILGAFLAAAVIGHVVLRQPWVIEARSKDPVNPSRQVEWRVTGWRKSGEFMKEIVADLAAGRELPPAP